MLYPDLEFRITHDNHSSQAVSQGGSSMPYAVTKAAQVQLVKCLAVTVGPKIRVNTVLPGLLLTEWVRFRTLSKAQHHRV